MTGDITVGIDPHRKVFTAAALDGRGRLLAHEHFDNSHDGHAAALAWANGLGSIDKFGIEGTGGLGRPLAEFLVGHDVEVREVPPHKTSLRQRGRHEGKSDRLDAHRVAVETQNNDNLAYAFKHSRAAAPDQVRDQIALWHGARTSLRKIRVQLIGELDALIQALPEELRTQLPTRTTVRARINAVARLDDSAITNPVHQLQVHMIRQRTQMVRETQAQDKEAQSALDRLLTQAGTTLPAIPGIAARAAAEILLEVGDVHWFTEPGFARNNGTAPIRPVPVRPAGHRSGTDSTGAATGV